MKLTPKQAVYGHLRACGPCTVLGLLAHVQEQTVKGEHWQVHQVSEVLTRLIREGLVIVYDTGDAFDADPAPSSSETQAMDEFQRGQHRLNLERTIDCSSLKELRQDLKDMDNVLTRMLARKQVTD
jgi:hypothetical protein